MVSQNRTETFGRNKDLDEQRFEFQRERQTKRSEFRESKSEQILSLNSKTYFQT